MISRFKDNFAASSMMRKLLIVSSLFLIASAFFPWYRDLDSRNVTSQFLGVTGPLYLIGMVILGSGIFSFAVDFVALSKSSTSEVSDTMRYGQIVAGLHSFFLTVLAASIYFHPQFGLGYISTKSSLFGIYLSGLAALSVGIFSGLILREKAAPKIVQYEEPETYEHHQERDHAPVTPSPAYRVERKQIGFETHVKTGLGAHSSFSSHSDNSTPQ